MRILVCGGRDYEDYDTVRKTLDGLLPPAKDDDMNTWLPPKGTVIIQGGASGADSLAVDWAVVNWVPFEEYKADWETHGKAAGPIRNKEMLEKGKPDVVVAFPGGRGTAHMVKIAKEAGVKVIEVA